VALTIVPLDVTHKALTTRARVEGFRALGTRVGHAVAGWTDFFERFDMEKYHSEGAPLHDPLRDRLPPERPSCSPGGTSTSRSRPRDASPPG
jgi:hypothetical protein